jgi:hypothetical protein
MHKIRVSSSTEVLKSYDVHTYKGRALEAGRQTAPVRTEDRSEVGPGHVPGRSHSGELPSLQTTQVVVCSISPILWTFGDAQLRSKHLGRDIPVTFFWLSMQGVIYVDVFCKISVEIVPLG